VRPLHESRMLDLTRNPEKIGLFRCRFPMQNETMIYGYARVSTAAQDESGQVKQLKAAGCGKVFREKITGTTADRPQLAKLMKALAPGDVVITPAVDRLSRDTTDLLVIARDMQRAGAGIRSLAEPFLDTTSDFADIIFAILGVAAKLERRRILERIARGRVDAKANGVKFGRKPILTPHQQNEVRHRLEAGETQRSVARSYNVSQSTISRLTPKPPHVLRWRSD
jgi:DNA invertase Pin-like site-specific DNA recombinase